MSSHHGLINLCITMTSLLQTAKKAPTGGGHSLHRRPVRQGGGAQPEVALTKPGKVGGPHTGSEEQPPTRKEKASMSRFPTLR